MLTLADEPNLYFCKTARVVNSLCTPSSTARKKIHLICSEALCLLFEQRRILVDDILICPLEILFRGRLVCMNPHQPRQLLHIRRMVVYGPAYLPGQLGGNMFARSLKASANVIDPILRPDLGQIYRIAELVKRKALFLKKFIHKMLLAAKQAIRHRFL